MDYPISELRIVRLFLKGMLQPHLHMMHESQVDVFVRASINLHHVVGNPHNGVRVDNLEEITVCRLDVHTVSYWWCIENLMDNDDSKGAQLNQESSPSERVFVHPDLLAAERENHPNIEDD